MPPLHSAARPLRLIATALGVAGALGAAGCATMMPPVNPAVDEERAELQTRAADRPIRIQRSDGTHVQARNVGILETGISWDGDRGKGVLPVSEVSSVHIRKSSLASGAGGGALIGFLTGAALGGLWRIAGTSELSRDAATTAVILGAYGVAGGTIGGAFGIAGAMTWLEFPIVPEEADGGGSGRGVGVGALGQPRCTASAARKPGAPVTPPPG